MLRLAEKAFWPAKIPFPVMHVDTGHNFPEVIEFRDRRVAELGVRSSWPACRTPSTRAGGRGDRPATSPQPPPDGTLLDAIEEHGFDAPSVAPAATRRRPGPRSGCTQLPRRVRPVGPEEPAPRAVEPLQRPHPRPASTSGSSRCPTGPSSTSGTTSAEESIELPSIYYAHEREVFDRDGMLLAVTRVHPCATTRVVRAARCVPHRRRRHLHRCRRVHGGHHRARSSTRSPPPASPSAAPPEATTVLRGRHGRPQAKEGYF
jgi:sulfate adenylyltransferase subunit 2